MKLLTALRQPYEETTFDYMLIAAFLVAVTGAFFTDPTALVPTILRHIR